MEKLKVKIKKHPSAGLMIPIPKSIAALMSWYEGDTLAVAFHEIDKVSEERPFITKPESTGADIVTVKIGTHEPFQISQKDVIDILESSAEELKIYRTAYLTWKGKNFGVKNVCKKVFDFDDFNTIQGEKYLKELGFPTFRK